MTLQEKFEAMSSVFCCVSAHLMATSCCSVAGVAAVKMMSEIFLKVKWARGFSTSGCESYFPSDGFAVGSASGSQLEVAFSIRMRKSFFQQGLEMNH